MNELNQFAAPLREAGELPDVLAAAYAAFDGMLLAIRGREDPATGMFAALVMSAASAADGRDAVARAPSLVAGLGRAVIVREAGEREPGSRQLAVALLELAGLLAGKLAAAGQPARRRPGARGTSAPCSPGPAMLTVRFSGTSRRPLPPSSTGPAGGPG